MTDIRKRIEAEIEDEVMQYFPHPDKCADRIITKVREALFDCGCMVFDRSDGENYPVSECSSCSWARHRFDAVFGEDV